MLQPARCGHASPLVPRSRQSDAVWLSQVVAKHEKNWGVIMVQDADLMMIWCRFNDDWRFDVNQQQLIIGTWIGQTIVYPILAIIQWQRLMVLIRALDSKNCFGSGTWDSPSSPWQTPSKVRGEERIPLSSEVRGVLPSYPRNGGFTRQKPSID